MEKWGLGYEGVLRERFPRLIHCRVSGFGADGPDGGFPGYDAVLQAMIGLMSINGTEDSGPTRLGNPIVDIATGLFAAIAILMALQERERSGQGQFCDMTLHDCGMALLHPHAANYFLNGRRPHADGQPAPEPGALLQVPHQDLRDLRRRRQRAGLPQVLRLPRHPRGGEGRALRHQRRARGEPATT